MDLIGGLFSNRMFDRLRKSMGGTTTTTTSTKPAPQSESASEETETT
jgi:hypothetical protein